MQENRHKSTNKRSTLFGWLERKLRLNHLLRNGLSPYYIYRLLYGFLLGLLYIWNAHYHEKMLYKIHQLRPFVDGLRVKYMRIQSSHMLQRKQSEVAKRVEPLGIGESSLPPYTITVHASRKKNPA